MNKHSFKNSKMYLRKIEKITCLIFLAHPNIHMKYGYKDNK